MPPSLYKFIQSFNLRDVNPKLANNINILLSLQRTVEGKSYRNNYQNLSMDSFINLGFQ